MLPAVQTDADAELDAEIHTLFATFRDPARELAYAASRLADDVRAASLAALLGGLSFAGAVASDFARFSGDASHWLAPVLLFRSLGVALCLGCALAIWRLRKTQATRVLASLSMLGTLLTYCVIAYAEETAVGPSDFRVVFMVFALLAFIFFPVPVRLSIAMAALMLIEMIVLGVLVGADSTNIVRTAALMVTFAVAGGLFSATNNRARRKQYSLRQRIERVNEALRLHKQNLEEMVQVRTAQLRESERNLIAAQRMESIGRLAGGLAHDINNMLATIMTNAEITLMFDTLPEAQHDILAASSRASELTRDLLTFSRRRVMELVPLSLGELVRGMEGILRTAATGVALQVEVAPTLRPIHGARGPIEQMIVNLVINARDAMVEAAQARSGSVHGTITIDVRELEIDAHSAARQPDTQAGTFVRMSIADTGTGIPPELLERIFEPFFTTKPEGRGSGLGLAVVHGIVRQHGGFIEVSSVAGAGTEFRLYFPLAASGAPPNPST
jgi:signal transduction histidine kinase